MARRNWTKEELYIALRVYCELPFGQFHQHQPRIIEIAKKLGRTPSALAMKLCNFASLDANIQSSGRSGLKSASALDREVWNEVNRDWEAFLDKSEPLLEKLKVSAPDSDLKQNEKDTGEYAISAKARRHQSFFRKAVLSGYNYKCCITGIDNPIFLVASHIIPWRNKDYQHRRLDPKNGLSLSSIHDRAFDCGLLTLNEHLEVVLSSQLLKLDSQFARDTFDAFAGQKIFIPKKLAPCSEALAFHRTEIFQP